MDLAKVKKWLESIPKEQMEMVKKLYPEANRLKHLCLLRGWLLLDSNRKDFIVINRTPEVRKLKKLYKKLGVGGIKFKRSSGSKPAKEF